jgi:hypothetical protein
MRSNGSVVTIIAWITRMPTDLNAGFAQSYLVEGRKRVANLTSSFDENFDVKSWLPVELME